MTAKHDAAFNPAAPADEKFDAQAQLQREFMPRALSDLLPQSDMESAIEDMRSQMVMTKALQYSNVIPFPSRSAKSGGAGMQSIWLDDRQLSIAGDWRERPTAFTFDVLRTMVDQTPVLSAVVLTRMRQMQQFCRVQESGRGPGFAIRHVGRDHKATPEEMKSMQLLTKFFGNCGWEFNARKRKALRRDSLPQFIAKLTRDTLTMDSVGIETEGKKNRDSGIDGFYAVDGSTIRLCTEQGYRGIDEIFALQVVQGEMRTAYTFGELIYEPRNPRSDVMAAGYGLSEVELMVRVVTGFMNAMTLNIRGFSDNSIPKGMLHLTGKYTEADMNAFKRYWKSMVNGVQNSWALPVMVSEDQESKASFEKFGVDFNEMYFAKWMTFLTSIICALYGISPDEINFESFSASKSSLSGSDTTEKLADSKDKGLKPLLHYVENLFTDFILSDFSDKYCFRFTGLDEEDEAIRNERAKLVLSVNEMRAQEGYEHTTEIWGDAPLNPSLVSVWQQSAMPQPEPAQPVAPAGDDAEPNADPNAGDGDGDGFGGPATGAEQPRKPGDGFGDSKGEDDAA